MAWALLPATLRDQGRTTIVRPKAWPSTSLQLHRSDAQGFHILQVTFNPEGFMAAVESGLLKFVAAGHFHWLASLRHKFQ